MYLQVKDISKAYGVETLLDSISFIVNTGERVGLVGPNGCGKTTLLDIIAGDVRADSGSVSVPSDGTLGYLRQGITPSPGTTIRQQIESGLAEFHDLTTQLDVLAADMASASGGVLDEIMTQYGIAQSRFEALGGYEIAYRSEEILSHLGLAHIDPDTPVDRLSGGEQTRVGLAGVLIANPHLLLLDEPTNHLDIAALEWLEEFLLTYPGAVLIVSHDRTFLDGTVTRILELDDETHQITAYAGNYTDYEEAKARQLEKQWHTYTDQQEEIQRIRGDIHRTKMHAKSVELTTTPGQPGVRRYAKKVAQKAKSREKKLERFMQSDEIVEKPRQRWALKMDFGDMPRGGQEVIRLEGVGHRYEGMGWLFHDVNLTLTHGRRIVLLGANGTGKSTLSRIITGKHAPTTGKVRAGANVRIGYMPQKQESLVPTSTPLDEIRSVAPLTETDARNFLHFFLFAGDSVFTPVEKLSYGERSRLLLAKLVMSGANCLLLDEPLNHLDIRSRVQFEEALDAFPGAILVIAHDRAFIDRFATGIWLLEDGTVRSYLNRGEMQRLKQPS